MQIVHANELPIEEKKSSGRVGSYRRRVVLRGEPGSPGNFSLIIYNQNGSFRSPRHHHNFDQFRYQIDGMADFDRNGKLRPGMLGYFPEGAYYGPQSGPEHIVAVLQFGGPSGSGYLSPQQSQGAHRDLNEMGMFEGGVYRRNPGVEGKKNQDSYEAVWQHVHKRPLVYPKPQYLAPIVMDSNNVPPSPLEGVPGVEKRTLGTFTNCEIPAARYTLSPGAAFVAKGRGIYMVLSGGGAVEGEALQELTTIYLDDSEQATLKTTATTEILLMGMPSVERMAKQPSASTQQQAAE
jgi:hypothetical protein